MENNINVNELRRFLFEIDKQDMTIKELRKILFDLDYGAHDTVNSKEINLVTSPYKPLSY